MVTFCFHMEIQKQRKLLPTHQIERLSTYRRGITRIYIAKYFAKVLVFVFISVHFSNAEVKKKPAKFNLIYILLWTPYKTSPFIYWSNGQNELIKSNCSVMNCYITTQRDLFGGDMKKFDAIVFNGRNLKQYNKSDLPKERSRHQKYIFLNMESSDNQPICNPIFDNFFNWTATYKLNSDVIVPYFSISNKAGKEIVPRSDMTWIYPMSEVNNKFRSMLQNKSKAVAWFVSHCRSRSRREYYAMKLEKSLRSRHLTLDVFGKCGTKKCPRSSRHKCLDLVKKDYYFYLSFENSFAEDYITEKVVDALLAGAAPVVYGGADYSRFLPPNSYIDATRYTPKKLAELISHLIATPAQYQKLFSWRNHYNYHSVNYAKVACKLCKTLNARAKIRKVYRYFRSWWNGDHKERCKDKLWGS